MTECKVRKPGEGEPLVNPTGARVVIRVTGEETGGLYKLIEAEQLVEGAPAPLHIHDLEDEAIQVLEGRLTIIVGGREIDAPAGTYVFVPRGVSQTLWNPGPDPCRYQSIFSPAGQEHYFRAAYSLDRSSPDYQTRIAEIRGRYGLRYPSAQGVTS